MGRAVMMAGGNIFKVEIWRLRELLFWPVSIYSFISLLSEALYVGLGLGAREQPGFL